LRGPKQHDVKVLELREKRGILHPGRSGEMGGEGGVWGGWMRGGGWIGGGVEGGGVWGDEGRGSGRRYRGVRARGGVRGSVCVSAWIGQGGGRG